MKRSTLTRGAVPAALVLSLALAACGGGDETTTGADDTGASAGGSDASASLSGTLVGAGSSAQQAAVQAWTVGFQAVQPDVTVNYDPIGSGGGRELFLGGGSDFAGSDAFLSEEELAASQESCAGDAGAIDLPVYVSPIAVVFNLPGVEALNMTPAIIAGIFAETITSWDDPALVEANPDAELPGTAITPVHRSDDSGTTKNFTAFLAEVAGDTWTYDEVETWPTDLGGEAGAQTSGVVSAVQAGEGYVGYADASQAGDLGTAAVGSDGAFVEYSPEAAAAVLDASAPVEGRPDNDIAIQVDREAEGAYPIVLISYAIACLQYDDPAKAELVKGYLGYVASAEGQDAAAANAGSAPISDSVREQVMTALDAIQ